MSWNGYKSSLLRKFSPLNSLSVTCKWPSLWNVWTVFKKTRSNGNQIYRTRLPVLTRCNFFLKIPVFLPDHYIRIKLNSPTLSPCITWPTWVSHTKITCVSRACQSLTCQQKFGSLPKIANLIKSDYFLNECIFFNKPDISTLNNSIRSLDYWSENDELVTSVRPRQHWLYHNYSETPIFGPTWTGPKRLDYMVL